jgi:hypothetical protein
LPPAGTSNAADKGSGGGLAEVDMNDKEVV